MEVAPEPLLLKQCTEIAHEAFAVIAGEGRVFVTLDLAAIAMVLAALCLFGMAHQHEGINGALIVDVAANTYGFAASSKRHGG